jgi:YMGG-like Gly-zipper
MRRCKTNLIATTLAALIGSAAMSGTPIVYPAKNQTAEQQKKDEGECNTWAKENTGVDPVVLASTPTTAPAPAAAPPPSSGRDGSRARGAARGAAAGAVIGEIANDDASEGAAVGAAAGAVAAGSRQRRGEAAAQDQAAQQQQQQQAAQQQAEADKQKKMETYHRAYAACLEGRGYTIK